MVVFYFLPTAPAKRLRPLSTSTTCKKNTLTLLLVHFLDQVHFLIKIEKKTCFESVDGGVFKVV